MYWSSNYNAVTSLIEEAQNQGAPAWLLSVRGTIHVSQSDFSILYPHICAVLLKMTANPKRALDINVSASLEFLKTVMPARAKMIDRSMQHEHLLATAVLDDLPTEHKPTAKWIAARLKVPHEFRTRVVPKLTRKVKRHTKDQQTSDEIWMHVRPLEEEVKRYLNDKLTGKEHDGKASPTDKEHGIEDGDVEARERPASKRSWSTASSVADGKSQNRLPDGT